MRANTAIAQSAGIEIDRAVVVNERMETNLRGVYACGDCAQFKGVNYALWPEAQEQGKTAGPAPPESWRSTSLSRRCLPSTVWAPSCSPLGDPGKQPGVEYKTVEVRDEARNTWSGTTSPAAACAA